MHNWEHQFGMKRNIDKGDNFKSKEVQNKKFRFDSKKHQSGKKRKFDKGGNFKNMMSKFDKKQKQIEPNKSICEKCGKKHFGQCLIGSGKCFRCGEIGHRKMKCPLEKKNNMPECFEGQANENKFLEGTYRPSKLQCYEKQLMHVEGEILESKLNKPMITSILAITSQKAKEFEEAVTEMSDKMNGQAYKLTIEVEKQNRDKHSSKKSDLDEGDNFKNTKLKGDKQEQKQSDRPMCGLCKKKHFGQCLSGTEKCFKCGVVGHLKRNCHLEKKNNMQEVFQGQAQQNKVLEDNSILGISKFYGKQSLHVEGETPENQSNQSMKIRAFALTSQNVEGFEEVIIDKIDGQTSKLTIEVEMQNCEQKSSKKSDLDEGDFKNTKLRRDMQDLIQSNKPICEHCGKNHFGQCLCDTGKCFSCGEAGHLKRNCPSEKKKYISEVFLGQAQQEVLEDNNILGISKFYDKQSLHVEGETSEKRISQPMKTRALALSPQKVEGFEEVKIVTSESKNMSNSLELARKEFAEFEEKVKKSVLLSDLSPEVTTAVLKMALEQFGNVVNIEFIPNLTIPYDMPQCALVEMEHAEMASKVIKTMKDFPFMISGMPRPVSANPAKAEMFSDRPAQPGRKINFRWVDKSNPDFEVGERLKRLCSRHGKESLALAQLQLEEEEKLAKQQEDMVLSNYKKHEMIELLLLDGIAARLAHRYGIDLSED